MINDPPPVSDALVSLHEARLRIANLLPRLEQANKAFASAARPLDNLSEMDSEHRLELAKRIRAANQEWEDVTKLIHEALSLLNTGASSPP
jgi:hypothetical protein